MGEADFSRPHFFCCSSHALYTFHSFAPRLCASAPLREFSTENAIKEQE